MATNRKEIVLSTQNQTNLEIKCRALKVCASFFSFYYQMVLFGETFNQMWVFISTDNGELQDNIWLLWNGRPC